MQTHTPSLASHAPSLSQRSQQRGGKINIVQDELNLDLETYINSLKLQEFFVLPEEEQNELLTKIDALQLFYALQDVNREYALCKLENMYLQDFLEKNDPKLLIGLQQRREYQPPTSAVHRKDGIHSVADSMDARSKQSISRSALTSGSVHKSQTTKIARDYRLNFRAKADMADKTANDVEKRVREIEKTATREIKTLRGRMEEMRYIYTETQETAKNFQLHFIGDQYDIEFLNTATERQIERKVRKFLNNWIKNAKALLATMRLKITALQENCQQLRGELLTKSELSGILTGIDFEKLLIKRDELIQSLEEKNTHMAGLKGVTGRASLAMSEEKQLMMHIEEESKKLTQKILEVVKSIGKLEKEANLVEADNMQDMKTLENLKTELNRFVAPSVNQYIEIKDEVMALEKEEKMLKRKLYILEMKLENTLKRCKQKPSSIYINHI